MKSFFPAFLLLLQFISLTKADYRDLKPQPRTRDEVNSQISREKNGVYFLTEATFDDFINYNDLVLICFYETGDIEQIVSEMLASVSRRV